MVAIELLPVIQTLAIVGFFVGPASIPNHDQSGNEYDFIVIGGGTAGSIVASKLATMYQRYNILVLEAGGTPGNIFTEIPLTSEYVSAGIQPAFEPFLFRNYFSKYQTNACGSFGGLCRLSTGNGLGGGSTTNDLRYVRGSKLDYGTYFYKYGCTGWSYNDVLPVFESFEDRSQNIFRNNSKRIESSRTFDPKIGVLNQIFLPKIQNVLLEFFQKSGYDLGNYNIGKQSKIGKGEVSTKYGIRSSSWNEYLEPSIFRKNLNILTFAKAIKINFNSNKRAVSVDYIRNGNVHTAKVRKELILSAGTIESPKLLMLSGVGDFDELNQLKIKPLILNIPSVGKHFQDHPAIQFLILSPGNLSSLASPYDLKDFIEYLKTKNGYFSKTVILTQGFLTDEYTSINENDTKVQIFMNIDPFLTTTNIILYAAMVDTKSRGSVKLVSNDPFIDPIIDPGYLQVQQDMDIFVRVIQRLAKQIVNSNVFRRHGMTIVPMFIDGCGLGDGNNLQSTSFLECFVRRRSQTSYHMTSTCSMGRRSDVNSVVDHDLRLIGSKNVRIVDASILPQSPRGCLNAPTTMIANKFIHMISREY